MERSEISVHEVKVYLALKAQPEKWLSNAEVSTAVKDVSPRTIRAHTLRLVNLGILDQAEIFPAHKYRLSAKAAKRNSAYVLRLTQTAEIMGLQ